ncbi:hypothetical protein [Zunongwangia pacifica]|uniref:Uncharacterized protein n=1 Tax=Zunongwangia pacifica TaxID=2911062 RepID=A0A9X2CMK9_9FLAO|nr:hypothetical protein [Zunongwangia pacifica]MCL6219600.1 hypothetical protein [Zunongwangia pacifica]
MRKLFLSAFACASLLFGSTLASNAETKSSATTLLPPLFQNCDQANDFLASIRENPENYAPYLYYYTIDYLENNDCPYATSPNPYILVP